MTHLSGFERAMEALDRHGVPRHNGNHRLSLVERIDALATGQTVPELMGATEAATTLGVTTSNLGRVARMPAPIQTLTRGDLYLAEAVRELAAKRRRRDARR